MGVFVNVWFLLLIVQLQATSVHYKVQWLGNFKLNNPASTRDRNVIHCYKGTAKTVEKLWRTTEIHIFIKNEAFDLYIGASPDKVQVEYESLMNLINFGSSQRTLSLDPFKQTCIMVSTEDSYGIQVFIKDVDTRRVMLMWAGVVTVFLSRILSKNPAFFYLCASILGVFALLILFLYLVTQRSVFKTGIITAIIIGGWTTVAFFFRQLWIVQVFEKYSYHLIGVAGFLSFLLVYTRIGPPETPGAKNVMMWIIQGIGVAMIFSSSWHEESSAAVIVLSIGITNLVRFFVKRRRRYLKVDGDEKENNNKLADKKQKKDSMA